MFDTATYVRRRNELKKLVNEGVVIFLATMSRQLIFPITVTTLSVRIRRSSIISVCNAMDW